MKSLFPDRNRRRQLTFLALISMLSVAGYLFASHLVYRLGFPLDDAWIHHTYARNLALHGKWAFLPNQPSAGSTAPLWSAVLAIGHFLHLGPYLWSYALGWMTLLALALVGMYIFRVLCPQIASIDLWVGLFLILEWHLVWAAVSGMETLLIGLLALIVLARLAVGESNWLALGALIGLSVWVRPDGITLIGPALFTLILASGSWRSRAKDTASLILGMLLLLIPYLLFNRFLEGSWWPNTFFAKQAEYAVYRIPALWRRFLSEASLPLIGAGALLLPGFIGQSVQAVRTRSWGVLAGAIWTVGYLFLYALRLPVTYQHGRYVMPAMPAYFTWGLAGMLGWIQLTSSSTWRRVISRTWMLSTALVLVAFWGVGARAYAYDVALIESEMVAAARWVASNTPSDALVAAHDIGALGYFAQRDLLDLAGLVSPDVIPFIRDEPRLVEFLQDRHADYLVTFPGWYPLLVQRARLIYSTSGSFSPAMGGENMKVYQWMPP
jgi:hypothetical protein